MKNILLIAAALGAMALVGCGSDEDPADNADVVTPDQVQPGQRSPVGAIDAGGGGGAEASATPETGP